MKDINDIILIWYLNRYWKYGKEKHDIHDEHVAGYGDDGPCDGWCTGCTGCTWQSTNGIAAMSFIAGQLQQGQGWFSWPSPEEKLSGNLWNLYFHPIQFQLTTDYKTKLIWLILMLYVENASPLKRRSTSSPVLPQIGSVAPSKDTKQTYAQQHTRTLPIKIQRAKRKRTVTYGKIASTNVVTVLTVQCFDTIFLPTASHTNCNLPQKQSKFLNSMSFLHICVFHRGFHKLSETRLFHKDGSLPLVSSKGKPPRKSNCPRCLSEPFSGQIANLEEGMDMRK